MLREKSLVQSNLSTIPDNGSFFNFGNANAKPQGAQRLRKDRKEFSLLFCILRVLCAFFLAFFAVKCIKYLIYNNGSDIRFGKTSGVEAVSAKYS
jgi:hypothetical protein